MIELKLTKAVNFDDEFESSVLNKTTGVKWDFAGGWCESSIHVSVFNPFNYDEDPAVAVWHNGGWVKTPTNEEAETVANFILNKAQPAINKANRKIAKKKQLLLKHINGDDEAYSELLDSFKNEFDKNNVLELLERVFAFGFAAGAIDMGNDDIDGVMCDLY